MGHTARHHWVKANCELFTDIAFGTRDAVVIRCTCWLSVPVEGPSLEMAFGVPAALVLLAVRPGTANTLNRDRQDPCRMSRVVILV